MDNRDYLNYTEAIENLMEIKLKMKLAIEHLDTVYSPDAHIQDQLLMVQRFIDNKIVNVKSRYVCLVDINTCQSKVVRQKTGVVISASTLDDFRHNLATWQDYFEPVTYPLEIEEELVTILVNGFGE